MVRLDRVVNDLEAVAIATLELPLEDPAEHLMNALAAKVRQAAARSQRDVGGVPLLVAGPRVMRDEGALLRGLLLATSARASSSPRAGHGPHRRIDDYVHLQLSWVRLHLEFER